MPTLAASFETVSPGAGDSVGLGASSKVKPVAGLRPQAP